MKSPGNPQLHLGCFREILRQTYSAYAFGALLVLAVAISIVVHRDHFVSVDTAQLISAARNLLAGEGFVTDILYYDEQFDSGSLPVPETIWPPGYAVLLMPLMALGLSGAQAAFVASLLCSVAVPICMLWIGALQRWSPPVSFIAAGLTASTTLLWWMSVVGATEPPFILCSLLCYAFLVKANTEQSERRYRLLLFSGVFAACAFLIRYAGMALVAALIVERGVAWLRARNLVQLRSALWACVMPIVVMGIVFGRNWTLAGSSRGAPDIHIPASLQDIVASIPNALVNLLGLHGRSLLSVALWAIAAFCVLGLLGIRLRRGRVPADGDDATTGMSALWWLFPATYILASCTLLWYVAAALQVSWITDRYVLPMLPFAVLLLAGFWNSSHRTMAPADRSISRLLCMALIAVFVAGQLRQAKGLLEWFQKDDSNLSVTLALDERVGGQSLREFLRANSGRDEPIIADSGQLLGALLELPVLSVPEPRYSRKIWDESTMRSLVEQYSIRWVVLLPKTFDASAPHNRNRPFFADLHDGQSVDWLRIRFQSPVVTLLEVAPDKSQIASEPLRE